MRIYKISALNPSEFKDNPEILNKYFRNEYGRPLDRARIPFEYWEKGSAEVKRRVAQDFGTSAFCVDLTDYIKDPRMYVLPNFIENMYLVDEWYREEDDKPIPEPNRVAPDVYLWNTLWQFCVLAVRKRKAMLLGNVLECIRFLNVVLDETVGFSQNMRESQVNAMRSYAKRFRTLLTDKDLQEFLKKHSDVDVFGNDPLTCSDYIQTYKALGQAITKASQEELPSVSDIYGDLDPVLKQALDNVDVELVEESVKRDFDKLSKSYEEDEELVEA